MKASFKLLVFLSYIVLIFQISSYRLLFILFLINLLFLLLLKNGVVKILKYNLYIVPIVLFTWIFNLFAVNISSACLLALRLVIVCNITLMLSKIFTVPKLGHAVAGLFMPLRIFRVDTKAIGIIVTIAISILPVLKRDITDMYYSLKAKGFNLKISNSIYLVKPILISILKRTDEMEKALIAKGINN